MATFTSRGCVRQCPFCAVPKAEGTFRELKDWPLAPKSCRWGGRWTGTPFCIPFGALVSAEIDNLLAADKAISTSHMANGATRLQPLVMNVGQAAGAAAALSVQSGCLPADLPVRELQHALIHDPRARSAVTPLWNTPWHHPQWQVRQLQSLDRAREAVEADLKGQDAGPVAPGGGGHSPQAQTWSGRIEVEGHERFSLRCSDGQTWPLITLEPGMHHWLSRLENGEQTQLIATCNPWGPWLRVSGLEA